MLLMERQHDMEHSRFTEPAKQLTPGLSCSYNITDPIPTVTTTKRGVLCRSDPDSALLVPMRAVAETADSQASTSGRAGEDCFGATRIATGFGSSPGATFAGVFRAGKPGDAQKFLVQLTSGMADCSSSESAEDLLSAAFQRCQHALESYQGLHGSAAVVTENRLAFCALGECQVALGLDEEGASCKAELLYGSESPTTPPHQDEGLSLGIPMRNARSAFGSVIAVDRAGSLLDKAFQGVLPVHQKSTICDSHQFLLLTVGPVKEAMTVDEAVGFVQSSRKQAWAAGHAASLLADECHRILAKQHTVDEHVTVAILHFKLPALAFSSASQSDLQPSTPRSQDGGPLAEVRSTGLLPPLLLSPSGRRVHFLEPLQGSEVAPYGSSPVYRSNTASPINAAPFDTRDSSSGSGDAEPSPGPSFPDSSGLLSSGSMLSQPNMSIPEDNTLPREHLALQLPPPLLPPVRKAYPSSELRITPEMLASPSPIRKAKMGRAASVNSPEGLFPLPPQRDQPAPFLGLGISRQSSGSVLGSRSRGNGEESRVRGGLPRTSSVPTRLGTKSPTTSAPQSPQASSQCTRPYAEAETPSKITTLSELFAKEPQRWPGARPPSPQGRKTHGQTAALRMLQASSCGDVANASSAPDFLGIGLAVSTDTSFADLSQACCPSSTTASAPQSVTSTESRGSCVRRVPVLCERQPQSLDADSLAASVPELPSGGVLEAKKNALHCLPRHNSERIVLGSSLQWTRVPTDEKEQQRLPGTAAWPQMEIDGAGRASGMLSSLRLEGRQHSGRAFSGSSLADSAGSLTLMAASWNPSDRTSPQ